MILQPLRKQDFAVRKAMQVDVANKGFLPDEIDKVAGPPPAGSKGGRWWESIWPLDREVPPERRNLRSEFGYQEKPLLTDLIAVAEAQGTPLDGLIKARLPTSNFYIMRCGVFIAPGGGEKFEALKFEVHYKHERASTFTMMPGPQTKKILELGGKADIGVDGKVAFGFPEVSLGAASADASAKAKLDAKFIVSFDYELKTPLVDSFGEGNRFCRWFMHQGDNLRNDVVFYPIIMTPKSVKKFECEFRAYFKISHPAWKHGELYENPPLTVPVSA